MIIATVSNSQGQYATNLLIEDAVPAVFSLDGAGTGAAAAIRTGNFVSLYLTGLGASGRTPTVLINGVSATVTYAGPGDPAIRQPRQQHEILDALIKIADFTMFLQSD
jgi:hypothetical protein